MFKTTSLLIVPRTYDKCLKLPDMVVIYIEIYIVRNYDMENSCN